jgi:hypothetical protein
VDERGKIKKKIKKLRMAEAKEKDGEEYVGE